MKERLRRQLAFALELDKEKTVLRQTHLTNHGRRENDAEHAWHMALMAYLLREYSNAPIDIARVMLMCLLHDVVEIDAGDTYAYDEAAKESQEAREAAAAERIFGLLPPDQAAEFRALFEEFDAGESADARFARAMDNLQPLLLNDSNDGGDWKEHAVTASQVYGRQRRTELGSIELFRLTDEILQRHVAAGHIKRDEAQVPEQSGKS